jgi:hypothetical protein
MEITKKMYEDAKEIVRMYENNYVNYFPINFERFKTSIDEINDLFEQLNEHVAYLEYDINPIGCLETLYDVIPKCSLEDINDIEQILDKLKQNFYATFE